MYTSGSSQELYTYQFEVAGLCGMCKERIEKTAIKKGKAKSAIYDLTSGILTIEIDHNKTAVSEVRWELAQAGHDNGDFKAPDDVYNALPLCCQHRDMENLIHHEEISQVPNPTLGEIQGNIYAIEDGKEIPLEGATIYLQGTYIGTQSDDKGFFVLDNSMSKAKKLVVSYVGFEDKILELNGNSEVDIYLTQGEQLETIEIKYRKRTTEVSFVNAINVETVTREELCKAACCNLSESFETNPSVDVSYSDAVTGTKQIQMLGLAGTYVQIGRELIPDVRGISSIYGLGMTPGPWIESIQLIKGTGSVVNGFESITGQINVELKKPEKGDLIFLNGYTNIGGRVELNANARKKLSDRVHTGILVHRKSMREAHDNNSDGFTDMPIEKDFVIANRWKFMDFGNFQGQVGVKYSALSHEGGYHDHFSGDDVNHESHWRMFNETQRIESWAKIGYIDQDNPETSVALQMSYVHHDQNSEFGFQQFDALQKSFYSNLIYQFIPNEKHTIRTGLSYQMDVVEELIGKAGFFERNEHIPGAYLEYAYKDDSKFTIIPGIRVDHHNNYGLFLTPRLHAKYNLSDRSIIRGVLGKGWRTANIFAENLGIFSSARVVNLIETESQNPYGLKAEEALNLGLSFTQGIDIASKELIISTDFYRTQFDNQIIVDYETPTEVSIYNLQGESYSNSFQIKLEYPVLERLDVRVAYRLFDVQADYIDGIRLEKPLVSKHRAFINAAYKTKSDWHFDSTLNFIGQKRLPNTQSNPEAYQLEDYSPNYMLWNAQIMKRWGNKWDVYVGAENILNYKQDNAIIAADDAFGQYFDASIVWAPLFGANIYAGFRMTITDE